MIEGLLAWFANFGVIAIIVASVAFGGLLAYELVFVRGLLSAAPRWSPQ